LKTGGPLRGSWVRIPPSPPCQPKIVGLFIELSTFRPQFRYHWVARFVRQPLYDLVIGDRMYFRRSLGNMGAAPSGSIDGMECGILPCDVAASLAIWREHGQPRWNGETGVADKQPVRRRIDRQGVSVEMQVDGVDHAISVGSSLVHN
jgi:hypothetical protein